METFDVKNCVNPFLIKSALIMHKGNICEVIDMDREKIFIKTGEDNILEISDDDWQEIPLNQDWLRRFNLNVDVKIKHSKTFVDWIIKSTGKYYYITIYNEHYGENPVIGLKYVHQLQEWYLRLTEQNLKLN